MLRCSFFFDGNTSSIGASLYVFFLYELGLAKDFHALQVSCNSPHIHDRFIIVRWIDNCPYNSFILNIDGVCRVIQDLCGWWVLHSSVGEFHSGFAILLGPRDSNSLAKLKVFSVVNF